MERATSRLSQATARWIIGCDPRDSHSLLAQQGSHMVELSARIARLTPQVCSVTVMLDSGPLRRLCSLGMPEPWRP
jgi:hypothetical protein